MNPVHDLAARIRGGDASALARAITWVENDDERGLKLLEQLPAGNIPVLGITGPPGAGKSTLVDALVQLWVNEGRQIAVLAVDPSAPDGNGSLLGDRIRLARHFLNPQVFIRSVSSRGASGGLSDHALDIIYLLQQAPFDLIMVETVGIGQTELDIASFADCTVVVLTPQAGDEVQAMKSGLMDVADVFVVNKGDLVGAEWFASQLRQHAALRRSGKKHKKTEPTPVLLTVATTEQGIDSLSRLLDTLLADDAPAEQRQQILTLRLRRLIAREWMKKLPEEQLRMAIAQAPQPVHLYRLACQLAERI
ncbi:MAG: methylmalonyl Co-A mutase-associated GTPase MeaB [Chitinophagales bacterium]|nr:methylmalonyl Co-A mutase-associated GTPase MeaB [Chitinophagales bacterium]MDW8393283.1 methylmalonyl Co-A mutase-associated GTPase MeaB [Chitinophagales bacterium]